MPACRACHHRAAQPDRAGRHAEPAQDLRLPPATRESRTSRRARGTILPRSRTRAFRRPVGESDPTVDTLLGFYEIGPRARGFETGIQYALARVLVDPQFIFRFEREPAGLRAGGGLSRQRSRAGVAAVVLPLEQRPGR